MSLHPARAASTAALLLTATLSAAAQNVIKQSGWEGFATRDPDGKFDRCVLYNRTIPALTVSPSDMLGLTRDGAGHVDMLVFFEPRLLTRTENTVIRMVIDRHIPAAIPGEVLSDFHAGSTGGLDGATVTALRAARIIDVTVEGHDRRFEVNSIGDVLDALRACVAANAAGTGQ